jgi:hypothetical protein
VLVGAALIIIVPEGIHMFIHAQSHAAVREFPFWRFYFAVNSLRLNHILTRRSPRRCGGSSCTLITVSSLWKAIMKTANSRMSTVETAHTKTTTMTTKPNRVGLSIQLSQSHLLLRPSCFSSRRQAHLSDQDTRREHQFCRDFELSARP